MEPTRLSIDETGDGDGLYAELEEDESGPSIRLLVYAGGMVDEEIYLTPYEFRALYEFAREHPDFMMFGVPEEGEQTTLDEESRTCSTCGMEYRVVKKADVDAEPFEPGEKFCPECRFPKFLKNKIPTQ